MNHEEIMQAIREETEEIAQNGRPQYIASSGRVATAFRTIELALYWQDYLAAQGVDLVIYDLTDYDWETNPANFKFHDMSTEEGMKGLFNELKPEVLH